MTLRLLPLGVLLSASICLAAEIDSDRIHAAVSDSGGVVTSYALKATERDAAGPMGLLLEGFGVPSYYHPNRRINEELAPAPNEAPNAVSFSYDCEGANIQGLRSERILEAVPRANALRASWRIENRGDFTQWVAPWVRSDATPGGDISPGDHVAVPTRNGVIRARSSGYHLACRNWIAAIDPEKREALYAVFDVERLHSLMAVNPRGEDRLGFQGAFTPFLMKPGDAWETGYRLNLVRGLERIDFATDELALEITYEPGVLLVRIAGVEPLPALQMRASVAAPNGRVWRLERKRFNAGPDRVVRCAYDWEAPADGGYEFLAMLERDGEDYPLGRDTGSPHGGVDTVFTVGSPDEVAMAPWSDAPFALQRGPRVFERRPAAQGQMDVWVEPASRRIYPEDRIERLAGVDTTLPLSLARGEKESAQIVLRPPEGLDLERVRLRIDDLVHVDGRARIPRENVEVRGVGHVPVRVPSHFEGPTGRIPDPLPAADDIEAPGGRATPIWLTVQAPADAPAGVYRGLVEITGAPDPIELWLEARVFDFALPDTPLVKTDFGFWPELAVEQARIHGSSAGAGALTRDYGRLALRYGITLREYAQLPQEAPDYPAKLAEFSGRLEALRAAGASTYAAPASLLELPELLGACARFAENNDLADRAFIQVARAPRRPSWGRVRDAMAEVNAVAPALPMMATAEMPEPFLHDELDIWAAHLPLYATPNARVLLERASEGGEVWVYVDEMPGRPYANLFLDFEPVEHRMLLWQTWALGAQGVRYWCVNYSEPGQDPWRDQLDATPVNGNGLLIYPGPEGPVPSIRLAALRDGIDDYAYLTLARDLLKRLEEAGKEGLALNLGREALNIEALMPDLTGFARDPDALELRRRDLGRAIEAMRAALGE